ncbi:hypothetical protein BT96DRAFT_683993 [Gymnopus androsaceus JB14]|uniref:Uncharacterized protein n=1 Tax=Gymnopus androsaceus JB14 TaxID=1447944 RepID=A0A6A4HQS2_9AGAR|nr:hypothetical protein BT96DRAFT_683993 [Gymnopus androsaceus JB14]
MLTGYPQKGAVHTPGALNGLWTGRMVIPSEFHLRALLLPPQPDPNDPAALGPEGAPNPNFNDPNAPPAREAGHRPPNFNEDTLGLVAVPLYVRFTEYVVFSGGKTVPCANDTMVAHGDGDEGNASSSGSGSRSSSRDGGHEEEASYDQGIRDAWFPPNTTLALEGDRVVVSVPPGADNMRVRTEREEFVYIKAGKKGGCDDESESKDDARAGRSIGSEAKARSQRQPGTFHDRDTCPGCLAREQALLATRSSGAAERGSEFKDQFIGPGLDPNSWPRQATSIRPLPIKLSLLATGSEMY